jgi:ParB family chromosome partitioning protein
MISAAESRVRLIPVDRIRIVNPRVRDKKKFELIVENIAKVGLKKPITVTVGKAGEKGEEMFDLVCGQGRLEAFIALAQQEIPALVRGMSETDSLLASLVENIARRRIRTLDQIQMIQWMKDQGNDSEDIARKTGVSEGYIKCVLRMLRNGEERLLEAVLHDRIPITIAIRISGSSDEESQRLLTEAYERKEVNQKSLTAFKRVIDQRRLFGRKYGQRNQRGSGRSTAESMVMAYRREAQRQKLLIKKAKLCETRLLSVSAIFKRLVMDDDYINLLRAEKLETMPKFLAERAQKSA